MKTLLKKILNVFRAQLSPPIRPIMPYGPGSQAHREYLSRQLQTIRIAEVKPGDTIVVSLPHIVCMSQEQSDDLEKHIRAEMKMPEGVNVVVFFGQVELFHLRKV